MTMTYFDRGGRVLRIGIVALFAAAWFAGSAAADELVLVEDGRSLAPIVVFEDAPPRTRAAADELAGYIERISGARPQLIEGKPDPVPEHAIWVGYQPVLDSLFPEQSFEFEHAEELLIAANEDHLVLAGRDMWNPEHMTVPDKRGRPVEGVQQEYGTINAVYTFLEEYLDVRWLWPGETGVDIVEKQTIAFEPFAYRYHPPIRSRIGFFTFSRLLTVSPHGQSQDWLLPQRILLQSLEVSGGHAFHEWSDRFGDERPELFALQPNGERSADGGRTAKLCLSNPAVAEQWLADVKAKLEENPNQRAFNASPNDGWMSGHCICEDCRAWDHPEGELRRFSWPGISQNYVALSDRHVRFANRCARLLKEAYPDENYFVVMMAYGHSRPAPIEARPDDNVIIMSVANFFLKPDSPDRGSPAGTPHREQYVAWGEVAEHMMWRPNTGNTGGWQQGMPDVPIDQTIETFKLVADSNPIALFVDSTWEYWSTQGSMYYLMAKFAWNPDQDFHAVMEDYYQRGFGPAAASVKAYWKHWEDGRNTLVAPDGSRNHPMPEVYDEAFFAEAKALLDQAASELESEPQIYHDRLAFIRLGLEWSELVATNMALAEQVRETGNKQGDAAQQIRANWERMKEIAASEAYPHAIRQSAARGKRLGSAHPDNMD